MRFLWVSLGGAAGSVLRYWVSLLLGDSDFPWGTLIVNIVGSFALGFLLSFALERWSVVLTTSLAVGLIGGFTTFSTFAWETLSIAQTGNLLRAAAYVGVSLVAGLAASVSGLVLGRSIS